jgi:hypothetical protein
MTFLRARLTALGRAPRLPVPRARTRGLPSKAVVVRQRKFALMRSR